MARTPSCDKSGMRKGTWTAEEDRKLIAYVTRYGCWNWRQLPKFAGLARCGKSCRLRWMNYLRPNIKRGNFTQDEEELIIKMHKKMGNKWSTIAAELPGRTDNEVKNHWHTSLKKRAEDNTKTNQEIQTSKSKDINIESTQEQDIVFFHVTPPTSSQFSDTTSPLSPFSSSSEVSSIDQSNENLVLEDEFGFLENVDESFWKDPYLDNISNTQSGIVQGNTTNNCAYQNQDTMIHDDAFLVSPNHSSNESLVMDNNDLFGSFLESYTESTVDSFWTHPFVADMCHVPSELVTPLAMESEYFSIVYDEDLWS